MSSTDQPMSRRAAREAARLAATGAVASLTEDTRPTGPAGVAAPAVPTFPAPADPALQSVPFADAGGSGVPTASPSEPPTATGLVGLDGQPLSRRKLRHERETQALQVVETAQATGPAPAEAAPGPTAEPSIAPASTPAFPTFPATGPALAAPLAAPAPTVVPQPPFLSTQPVPPAATPSAVQQTAPQPQAPAAPPAWTAPEGHWTRQLAQTDEDSGEQAPSREVGGVPQATSSILVVDHPPVLDLGGPLDATGELLRTGTIPLSQDFAQTGTVGSVGGAEHDDRFDSERPRESQPVKASAVASQHALGSPIVANPARRGVRGMTALLVTASVLAVLVTGLVVTAIVLGWFHP